MTAYGSRPDLLPEFVRAAEAGLARQLDLAESRQLESASIDRFPHRSADRIDWTDVSGIEQLVYEDEESAAQLLRELLRSRLAKTGRVVVFWGNLIVPSVSVPVDLAIAHADEVVESGPQFWVFAAEDGILIEVLQDGQVTVASVAE